MPAQGMQKLRVSGGFSFAYAAELFAVDPDSSYWTFDKDRYELQVTLAKASKEAWTDLLKAAPAVQPEAFQPEEECGEPRQAKVSHPNAKGRGGRGAALVPRRYRWRWGRVLAAVMLFYYAVLLSA
ncbi:unnamed protein product, partial [Effrenium voratum]